MTLEGSGPEAIAARCVARGLDLLDQARLDEARALFERALGLDPGSPARVHLIALERRLEAETARTELMSPVDPSHPGLLFADGGPEPRPSRPPAPRPPSVPPRPRIHEGRTSPSGRPPRFDSGVPAARPPPPRPPSDFSEERSAEVSLSGVVDRGFSALVDEAMAADDDLEPLTLEPVWPDGSVLPVVGIRSSRPAVSAWDLEPGGAIELPPDDASAVPLAATAPPLDREPLLLRAPDTPAIEGALGTLGGEGGPDDYDLPIEEPVESPLGGSGLPDPGSPEALLRQALDRWQLDDFDGALELLERIPVDHEFSGEARRLIDETRRQLQARYEAQIGNLAEVPRVLISEQEVIWLNLNHRAGFVLSQVDGQVSYEDILALSGMPRLDTLRILAGLVAEGVVGTPAAQRYRG